jgi:hypothetical protein
MKTKNTPTLLKSGRALISDRINVRISMVLEINKMSLLGNALIIFSGLRVSLIIRTAIFVLGFTNISTTLIKHKSNIYIFYPVRMTAKSIVVQPLLKCARLCFQRPLYIIFSTNSIM